MIRWLVRVAAWASQTANLFLLFGHHDQTISARCYCNRHRKGWRVVYKLVNKVFFWQDDHCRISHEQDIAFAKEILSYESTNNPN
jgi:hypothetical protein